MTTLSVHLFKSSFGPFLALLQEHEIEYKMREVRAVTPMAAGGILEIVQVVGNAAFWPSVAAVVVSFINSRKGRKIIITTQEGIVIHAEGLSIAELEEVLKQAKHLTAIDPNTPHQTEARPGSVPDAPGASVNPPMG